ncbi:dihydrodipicolinate reductase [Mycobacterium sp. 236(2023)]|uniref:NAD(P)H-dependent amine dehydrogenase family protein n=1 Tax=Mycobacterium sp. 236(2023) TaxID=3038163 RepID=UPI002414ED06|nr:dihydrodipicolinate reductase [Mycobacterium sp. 236(2023)]MDG4667911.1 dihydrodipicolinate reductase [Mycobacterium sp. 236(2023)]
MATMSDLPARVVQWATGTTGRLALRAIIDSPAYQLVGVRVYDPDKIGVDAGEIAGTAATGVTATDSIEAILALDADAVLYMGAVERYPDECIGDVATLLRSGIDVIATGSSFIDVHAFAPEWGARLDEACAHGGSSFLGLGLFPGFWGESVAPVLARLSARCGHLAVRESLCYAGYPSASLIFDVMGYGHDPESRAALLSDPSRAGAAFLGTASVLAKALGAQVHSLEPFRETVTTDAELKVAAGVIPAGTVAAMKLGVRAVCDDFTISVEHVTWMADDVAPEWSGSEGYEIEFDGAPSLRCNLVLGIAGEDHTEMGCLATAMHAVHAVPLALAAPPGVLDLADVQHDWKVAHG